MYASIRQIALALSFLGFLTGLGLAQSSTSTSPAASAVFKQSIRGVTVEVSGIQWNPFGPQQNTIPPFKTFYVTYHARASPPLLLPPHKSLLDYITAVSLISPDGKTVPGWGGGWQDDLNGAMASREANWEYVDPHWPLVAMDIELLDPAAPVRESGRSVTPITIAAIPVPTEFDKVTPVHVETITPLGTKVIVEKIKVSPGATGLKTYFVLRIVPASDAPDLQFSLSTGSKVSDDTGANLTPHGGGMAGYGDVLEQQPGNFRCTAIDSVPSPGAKTMTLTLDAYEASEALKKACWYRHFHILLPMRLLDASERQNYAPLAVVQNKDVIVSLDSTGIQQNRYQTLFTLRDRTASDIVWKISAVRGKDNAGNVLTSHPSQDTAFYGKQSGSPLRSDTVFIEAILGGPGKPQAPYGVTVAAPAKSLSLVVDVVGVREQNHLPLNLHESLVFPSIPVPIKHEIQIPPNSPPAPKQSE